MASYGRALALKPDYAEAHQNLGITLKVQGKLDEAAAQYRKAFALKPGYAEAHNNLGNVLKEQGKTDEAVAQYRQALTFRPGFADAHNNLGVALKELGKLEEAVAHCRQALQLKPAYAEAHNNLGNMLKEQGKWEEAAACYQEALRLKPVLAEAYNNLGHILKEKDRLDEAFVCFQRTLAIRPDDVDAHINLGNILKDQDKLDEARVHYQRVWELHPTDGLQILLATLLPAIAASKEEVLAIRRNFQQQVSRLSSRGLSLEDPVKEVGTTNFYLAYQGFNDRDIQQSVSRLYERACPSLLYTAPHCAIGARSAHSGKVVIGFVSHYFRQHSIGKYMRGLIANLSRDQFHVIVFFVPPVKDDDLSAFFRRSADQAVVLPGALQAARERIADEKVDVLVYPDIGMESFTYFLAFSRLAPVQCVSFGHPVTTGIRNIDYFLSAEHFEPEDGEEHYSERLVRLKSPIAYYFKPTVPAVLKSRSDLGLDDGQHIYFCPQTLYKFHPDFDTILAGILNADPRGRLVLKAGHIAHWAELLLQRFRQTMEHVMDRITVLPWLQGGDFTNLIAVSDVMLDTVHFGGYTTSMEAFAVGTPVVTLPGEFQRGRHTHGLYQEMGFLDCVADTPEQYVEIAVRLGTDHAFRETIKQKILARNHVLYENRKVVTEHERFFLAALKTAQVQTKKGALPGGGQKKRRASGDQK